MHLPPHITTLATRLAGLLVTDGAAPAPVNRVSTALTAHPGPAQLEFLAQAHRRAQATRFAANPSFADMLQAELLKRGLPANAHSAPASLKNI